MIRVVRLSVCVGGLCLLSGCSTIKSIFPDKEKDYRFTRELPELVVPQDLGNRPKSIQAPAPTPEATKPEEPVLENQGSADLAPTASAIAPVTVPPPSTSTPPQPKAAAPKAAEQPLPEDNSVLQTTPLQETPIEVSKYAEGVPDVEEAPPVPPAIKLRKLTDRTAVLQINQNLDRTWRIVGKAISQQALEISERNTTKHYYAIQYEPKAKALEDSSLWDDVLFVFGAENNQEQSYHIALSEKHGETDIQVLDEEHKVCSTDACIQLTKLLRTAIEKSLKD